MKRMLKKIMDRINLVDGCLILFMIILLIQSAYTLLVNGISYQERNTIDIIVRTSAASIFGYFISGNFLCKDSHKKEKQNTKMKTTNSSADSIGISSINKEEQADEKDENTNILNDSIQKSNRMNECKSLQIIITTAIGIFSLCTILIFRNFCKPTAYSAVTLSQFRDFVSGCVGFLIGSTKYK